MSSCIIPANNKYVEVINRPKFAAGTSVKLPQAAQDANPTQANAIGSVTGRHRSVRTGCTNLSGRNIETANRVTNPSMTQWFGVVAKITITAIFQAPGKP